MLVQRDSPTFCFWCRLDSDLSSLSFLKGGVQLCTQMHGFSAKDGQMHQRSAQAESGLAETSLHMRKGRASQPCHEV